MNKALNYLKDCYIMLVQWLCNCNKRNKPVPNKDAQWLAFCDICDDRTLYASVNGFKTGGTEHCHGCGNRRETKGMQESDIQRMIISSWCHWQKHAIIPYDWHTKSEKQKMKILFPKK
jgi:hypothetical protein